MPISARFFKGYFRNLDGHFEDILPANSKDHFREIYKRSDLRINDVEYEGFHKVDLYQYEGEIIFDVPTLKNNFNSQSWGYKFLYDYFPKEVRKLELEIELENKRQYGW